MRALLFIAALLGAQVVHAADPWSATDKALGVTAATALALDWRQTQMISENPTKWRELNPILGSHPTIAAVNRHFAANAIMIGLIANYLPSKYRKAYLGAVSVVEFSCAGHNYKMGIRMAF